MFNYIICFLACILNNSILIRTILNFVGNRKQIQKKYLIISNFIYCIIYVLSNNIFLPILNCFYIFEFLKYIFSNNIKKSIYYSNVLNLLYLFISIFFVNIGDYLSFNIYINRSIIFLLINLTYYLILTNDKGKSILFKIYSLFKVESNYTIIVIISHLILIFINFYIRYHYQNILLIELLFIMSFVIILIIIILIRNNELLAYHKEDYNKLVKDYNKLSYNYRILKHNLKSDLYAIKTSNTNNINTLIDSILNNYGIENEKYYSSDKKGILGLIELKLCIAKSKGINVSIYGNNFSIDESHDLYIKIIEAVGIVLDNAIESSLKTEEKEILVDISNNKIRVINSFNNSIDLDKIYSQDYSTKNRGSGLGLNYIKKLKKYNIYSKLTIRDNYFIIDIDV